jgi:hypothetical protein
MENNYMEQNDIDENQMHETTDADILSNLDNNDQSLDFMYTTPVTKTVVPSETTRNDVAQRFTLNKNQKAAFMIITGHLDGIDKMNEGSKIQ